MNEIPIFPPICSHCGERRGREHDSARCWTIAHAFAVVSHSHSPDQYSDHNGHIAELSRWLREHPAQRGALQYTDRETSLDRWVRIAQVRIAQGIEA